MIRYYAYYSCGGYKDLYLGNNTLKTEYTYFLPLLATWKKGTKPEYAEKLKRAKDLTQIEVVSKENYFDFPQQAKSLFSHGGYRVIYLTLSNGDSCLCVRDITNGAKDEEDRDIPFNILITATGVEDVKELDKYSLNSLNDIGRLYGLLATLLTYDPDVNGIKFDLEKINRAIQSVSSYDKELEHKFDKVNFMMVDSVSMVSTVLNELNLKREQIDYIGFNDGRSIGSLKYKIKSRQEESDDKFPPLTESQEKDVINTNEKIIAVEDSSEYNEKVSDETIQPNKTDSLNVESDKIKPTDDAVATQNKELADQFSNIQDALKCLLEAVRNLEAKVRDCQSTEPLDVQKIEDRIASLLENREQTPSLPIDSAADDNHITISKIHIWVAGIALIVGFLLGALIF